MIHMRRQPRQCRPPRSFSPRRFAPQGWKWTATLCLIPVVWVASFATATRADDDPPPRNATSVGAFAEASDTDTVAPESLTANLPPEDAGPPPHRRPPGEAGPDQRPDHPRHFGPGRHDRQRHRRHPEHRDDRPEFGPPSHRARFPGSDRGPGPHEFPPQRDFRHDGPHGPARVDHHDEVIDLLQEEDDQSRKGSDE